MWQHWRNDTLLQCKVTELADVRDLALLHLLFEDTPQITFTLKQGKAVFFSSLARQWSSWRCVWVFIMLEYCPAAQSPKGGDHALLQYVAVHVGIHGSLNEL